MDWVHCNNCYFQPGQLPKRNFRLTSCGHIFCQNCEQPGQIEQCKVCGQKCNTTALTNQMASEIQLYFEEPEILHEKMGKVMEFQKIHRQKLNENYRNLIGKYHMLKIAYTTLQEEHKTMKNEFEKLRKIQASVSVTPPQSMPQLPAFCHNSQAARAIRMGTAQTSSGTPNSNVNIFTTPKGYTPPQYRSQQRTPSTPLSGASSTSPVSLASFSSGSSLRSNSSQRTAYQPGYTPPLSSLRMMSISSQNARNAKHY